MWEKLCLLISVTCLAKNVVLGIPMPCHSDNRNTYPYTGTKTPYSHVYNNTGGTMTLANCKSMQIWMLSRHGTRYPSELMMEFMISNFTHVRDRIINKYKSCTCMPWYAEILKNWQSCPEFIHGKENYLAIEGEKDLVSLGERIRAKLPILFDEDVTKSFKFRSTATQRTIASIKSFIKGAFGISLEIAPINNTSPKFESIDIQQDVIVKSFEGAFSDTLLQLEVVPIVNDTLLKLYDTCESWNRINNYEEVERFNKGPEMTKVLADLTQRFPNTISRKVVFLLYDACRFERAVCPDKPSSPWCDVFTEDEMRVLEYQDDLFFYYHVGPGRKTNRELGCHPIRDMFERFTKLETDGDEPRGVFYFTHSHMISLFLTAMGIGKDSVPLTARNFRDMNHRNWRISRLVPFAANFAAVFHRCNSSDTPFKVAFYLNENPLTLEGCEDGICDWAQLKEKLDVIAANCSAEICQKES